MSSSTSRMTRPVRNWPGKNKRFELSNIIKNFISFRDIFYFYFSKFTFLDIHVSMNVKWMKQNLFGVVNASWCMLRPKTTFLNIFVDYFSQRNLVFSTIYMYLSFSIWHCVCFIYELLLYAKPSVWRILFWNNGISKHWCYLFTKIQSMVLIHIFLFFKFHSTKCNI